MRIQGLQSVVVPAAPVRRAAGTIKQRPTLDLLASAALSLALILPFLYFEITISDALPLAVLMGLLSRILFRLVFSSDRSDVFHPSTLVAGYFAVYFGLRCFYLYTVPFFRRLGRNPYDDYISAALWCACVGYIAFSSGIASDIPRRWLGRWPAPHDWLSFSPVLRILFLNFLGLASLIYLFKTGATVGNRDAGVEFQRHPLPGMVVLFENLIDLSWVAICVFLIAPGRKVARGAAWLLLGVSLGILCCKLAISGGKQALVQPFMEAAIVFHYGKRRFRVWEMLAIGIPILMMAFGAVNFYRFVVVAQRGASKNVADVVSRVSSATDMLKEGSGTGTQQSALQQMVDRNAGADALALIMKYTPHPFPYQLGQHWLEIPLTFVPRQIWKDKPVNLPSAEFEHTYMGEPNYFNGMSSMHLIGDLYRNFSLPGVICGMFVLGALLRFFYLYCSPSRSNSAGLFLYAALFPQIIHSLESDVGYAVIMISRNVILAIAVAVFLGARFAKRTPGSSPSRSVLAECH